MKKTLIILGFLLYAPAVFAAMGANEFLDLVSRGTLAEIQKAVEAGADVNARADGKDGKSSKDVTPLMKAAAYNSDPAILEFFVRKGADVNALNANGGSALFMATFHNPHLPMAEKLLELGADSNVVLPGGGTMLMGVAENGKNPQVIGLLVKAGADMNARYAEPNPELKLRCGPSVHIEAWGPGGERLTGYGPAGYTPLMFAMMNRDPEMVKAFLKAGADLNARDAFGLTPLMIAAAMGNSGMVKTLVEAGAKVNDQDDLWGFVMEWPVEGRKCEYEVIGIGRPGEITGKVSTPERRTGYSPLMFAMQNPRGNEDVIKTLLEAGADVNIRSDNDGRTALMLAAMFQKIDAMRILLSRPETRVDIKDAKGRTALDYVEAVTRLKNAPACEAGQGLCAPEYTGLTITEALKRRMQAGQGG